MIYVIKEAAELVATIRRVANQQSSYKADVIADLHQAADLLEAIATKKEEPVVGRDYLI